jgi:hypothetical protein
VGGPPVAGSPDLRRAAHARRPAGAVVHRASRRAGSTKPGGPAPGRPTLDDPGFATAEERGLLTVAGNRVEFAHPLVRSAVYQAAPSMARREAHLALAESLAEMDPARATWHRASAAIPPAEDVAIELADLGAAAVRRAATDLAARAFSRAAELTADPHRRVS